MIGFANYNDIDELKLLWSECFSDTQEFIDNYFDSLFEPCDVIVARENGKIVSMATIHKVEYVEKDRSKPCGYVYAVATRPEYRGQGYFKKVMSFAKKEAKKRGFIGLVTVPATQELVKLYKKIGYKTVSKFSLFQMSGEFARARVRYPLTKCGREEFINMRQEYLNTHKSYIKLDEKQLGFVYDYVGAENILTTDISGEKKYAVCEKSNDLIVVKEHNFTQSEVSMLGRSICAFYQVPYVNILVDDGPDYSEKFTYAMGVSFGIRKIKGYAKLMLD